MRGASNVERAAEQLIARAIGLFPEQRAEAVLVLREAVEKAKAAGQPGSAARALNMLSDVERMEGRVESAKRLAGEALELARVARDSRAEANAVDNLGLVAAGQGSFDQAVARFTEALELRQAAGDPADIAVSHNNLSLAHWERGDLVEAMDHQQRCLAIKQTAGDRAGVGQSQLNLGLIHMDLGDWDKALECYFRSLAESERLGDKAHTALCYNNIGEVYLLRGKLDRARFHLDQALELAEAAGARAHQAEVLGTMGEVAFAAGDFARAQDFYEQDVRICQETGDREELAETLRRQAELDLARADFESCRKKIDEALRLCGETGIRREEGNARRVLGELLAATGDSAGAEQALEESARMLRSLGKNYELACSLLGLGRCRAKGTQGREDAFSEALAIFENLGIRHKAVQVEALLGRARAVTDQAGLVAKLAELGCSSMVMADLCGAALELLTERLPSAGAALFLRDGRIFRHGQVESAAHGSTSLALEAGNRRLGTLVLHGVSDLSRLKTIAELVALGISNAGAGAAVPVFAAAEAGSRFFPGIIGADTSLRGVFDTVRQIAETKATVLILGESGTGKELVARTLHRLSGRPEGRFVAMNCAAIPEALLESELFGVEKGTATGVTAREGKFETADRGTVFLDEIGDMSLGLQAKLLRVLQERSFERVGGREPIEVDVRIVAATNQDLEQAMAEGRFRRDLYYRLNVVTLVLPPLRQRRQDIPALTSFFVSRVNQEYGKSVEGVTDGCLSCLMDCSWPGNVRELENVVERGVIMAQADLVTEDDLPPGLRRAQGPAAEWRDISRKARAAAAAPIETGALVAALEKSGWVVKRAAEELGVSRTQVYRMLKKHGLRRPAGPDSRPS